MSILRTIQLQLALLTAAAVFGISVVAFGHWWSSEKELDVDALAKEVMSSMQTQFDTGENTKNWSLQVLTDHYTLINVTGNGNQYQGMVTVRTRRLTEVPVAVTVYADVSGQWMSEMDPQSLIKLTTTAEQENNQ